MCIFGVYGTIADGQLLAKGMGGRVYAYDVKTGALSWGYEAKNHYSEILQLTGSSNIIHY